MMTLGKYKYTRNGMSKEELENYSQLRHTFPFNTVMESEWYGTGTVLRKYLYYPKILPIRIRITHGPSVWDQVTDHFIEAKEYYSALYSRRLTLNFEERTSRKCFQFQSPFWIYYKKNRNKFKSSKSGTIFFLSHSTFWTEVETSHQSVIGYLNNLPKSMLPISICMHFVDIQKKRHIPFLDAGFRIYTAGNWENKWFIHNFFEIVSNYKYAVSNTFGSQFLYCTMIGVKSIIYQKITTSVVHQEDTNEIAAYDKGYSFLRQNEVVSAFLDKSDTITSLQQSIVEEELGIKEGLSMFNMSFVLYKAYIQWKVFRVLSYLLKLKDRLERKILLKLNKYF